MKARPIGEAAVLLECSGVAEVWAVYRVALRELPTAVDIVPAARSVLVDGVDPAAVLAAVSSWDLSAVPGPAGNRVEIPVVYDGPDLEWVAERWGVSVQEAVSRHRDCEYVVAFCGFSPGFAYCAGLPHEYAVPRLDTPRPRVPAGSVALADTWTGVYPTASPGGWRLIGHTDAALWEADREPPALLVPGTRIRFVDG